MNEKALYKTGIRNIFYSFFSQFFVLGFSILLGFALPRAMGVRDFGYWQVYLFYTGYIMIFCFGFGDGLYLRYGQFNQDELPLARIRGAMRIFVAMLFLLTIVLFGVSFRETDSDKMFCFIMTSFNLVLFGLTCTLMSILQFTNQFRLNCALTLAGKVLTGVGILALLLFGEMRFQGVIWVDIAGKVLLLGVTLFLMRDFFLGATTGIRDGFREFCNNISVGVLLMFAVIAGSLLVGIGRFIVERFMSLEVYSTYSFATSLTLFVLTFLAAFGNAFFPILKRMPEEKIPGVYRLFNRILGIAVFCFLLAYFPLAWLVGAYFEKYAAILEYFCFFFIIIQAQAKMFLLITTYYKALREERALLWANINGLVVALLLIVPAFWVTRSIWAVVVGTVLALFWRCYASELYLMRKMNIVSYRSIFLELTVVTCFLLCASLLPNWIGMLCYGAALLALLIGNRRFIMQAARELRRLRG